jgi:hypothetical protein
MLSLSTARAWRVWDKVDVAMIHQALPVQKIVFMKFNYRALAILMVAYAFFTESGGPPGWLVAMLSKIAYAFHGIKTEEEIIAYGAANTLALQEPEKVSFLEICLTCAGSDNLGASSVQEHILTMVPEYVEKGGMKYIAELCQRTDPGCFKLIDEFMLANDMDESPVKESWLREIMQAPSNKKAKNQKKDVDYFTPDQQVLYIEKMLKLIKDMAEKLEVDLASADGQLEKLSRQDSLSPKARQKSMTIVKKYSALLVSLSASGYDLSSSASAASLRSEFISRKEDNVIFNCHNIQSQGEFLPFVKKWKEERVAAQRDAETVGLQQETEAAATQMRAEHEALRQAEEEVEDKCANAQLQRRQVFKERQVALYHLQLKGYKVASLTALADVKDEVEETVVNVVAAREKTNSIASTRLRVVQGKEFDLIVKTFVSASATPMLFWADAAFMSILDGEVDRMDALLKILKPSSVMVILNGCELKGVRAEVQELDRYNSKACRF